MEYIWNILEYYGIYWNIMELYGYDWNWLDMNVWHGLTLFDHVRPNMTLTYLNNP
jgi:hypothetical protein